MRKFVGCAVLATLSACVQPPNPAVETMRAAQQFGTIAAEAQRQQRAENGSPSEEVAAFQRTDARLHYGNASIVRDAGGCSLYQGTMSNGEVGRAPLIDSAGKPICRR